MAAHYGTPRECEFLEKVERLRDKAENDTALEECNLKLQQLKNKTHQAFYLQVAHEKAGILFALGNFEGARDFLRPLKNLKFNKEEDFMAAWGDCMYALGKAYHFVDELDSAIYFFKLALNSRLDLNYPNHEKLGDNYSYLGYVYRFDKGENLIAEVYYRKEENELLQYNADDYKMAVHYMNLAACISQNDHEKALNYNFKALSFLGDSEEDLSLKSQCLNNVANIYYRKDELHKAVKYYNNSLRTVPSSIDNFSVEVLGTYENLGSAYLELGELDSARMYQSSALAISKKLYGNTSKEAYDSEFLLSLCFSDLKKAKTRRHSALQGKRSFYPEGHEELTRAYLILADWFQTNTQTDSAFHYYQKALGWPDQDYLGVFQNGDIDVTFAYAISNKAALLFKCGKEQKSWKHISAAIKHYYLLSELYDQLLDYKDSEIERLAFVKNVKRNFEGAIEACYFYYNATGKGVEDLWFFIERSKSAILMLQAQESNLENNISGSQKALTLKLNLKGTIKLLEEQLKVNNGKSDSIRLELFDLHKRLDSVNHLLNKEGAVTHNPGKVISLEELRGRLSSKKDQGVIEIHVSEKVVYAIMVSFDTVKVARVEGKDFEMLIENCELLLGELMDGNKSQNRLQKYETYVNSAWSVYKVLLKPLEINQKKEIVLIPDGFLSRIPFEVLLFEAPKQIDQIDYRSLNYVIKSSKLTYGYSATWSFGGQKIANRKGPELSLLAFAYAGSEIDNTTQPLPGSLTEVNALRRVWNDNIKSFEGAGATESNFKKSAGNYDVIHLAVHNSVDTKNPLNSGLEFRNDNFGDGTLHVFEIYQLHVGAQMVVLSACETGLGEYQDGEGFSSVGRAFAQKGVTNIVSSLWKISDGHSSRMMSSFYKLLKQSGNPSSALHESKLRFIKEKDELAAHPSNWASLVYTGNPQRILEVQDQKNERWKIYVVSIILALGFLLFLYKVKVARKTAG